MRDERPELSRELDGGTFRSFYYRKEELADFCRKNGLSASGSKEALTERVAVYLDTGEILAPVRVSRPRGGGGELTLDTPIEPNFVCSERHRAFFKAQLGAGFTFPAPFQAWLKANTGKTYAQAVEAYRRIMAEKKAGTTVIGRQFEYNAYIRAFFADNPGRSLDEAIRCWNRRKGMRGPRQYEKSDLACLEREEP